MALCEYATCHKCESFAVYDENIGVAVLCDECNKTYEAILVLKDRTMSDTTHEAPDRIWVWG